MRNASVGLCFVSLFSACSLSRSTIGAGSLDAAPSPDAFALDAPRPLEDVTVLPDVFVPPDMGMDTGPSCLPSNPVETMCDRVDDDCDGTIDDDGVCGGCIAFTVAAHTYLSCPGPVSGTQAWSGACGAIAAGYELATFDSAGEQMAAATFLHSQLAMDPHWIGLNDFDAADHYVWRDRSTSPVPGTISPSDPMRRFVVFRRDNGFDQASANDSHRILCELTRPAGACMAHEATGCNGVDENCNGQVDEGQNCGMPNCTTSVFWDHVYYVCARSRKASDAASDCAAIGAATALASIGSQVELAYVGSRSASDAWVGLSQNPAATMLEAGWSWPDGSTFGVPPMRGINPWNGNEPNDMDGNENHQEDCAALLGGPDTFDDRACNNGGTTLPYVCERAWSY